MIKRRAASHGRLSRTILPVVLGLLGGLTTSSALPQHTKHNGMISREVATFSESVNPEIVGDIIAIRNCTGGLIIFWYTVNPMPALPCAEVSFKAMRRFITLSECINLYGPQVCLGQSRYEHPEPALAPDPGSPGRTPTQSGRPLTDVQSHSRTKSNEQRVGDGQSNLQPPIGDGQHPVGPPESEEQATLPVDPPDQEEESGATLPVDPPEQSEEPYPECPPELPCIG